MNYHNPYVRIQTYYSWLVNDKCNTQVDDNYDRGTTLTRLHEITDIPTAVIRSDFSCMFEWQGSVSLFLKNNPQYTDVIWDTVLAFDDENESYIDADERYQLDLLYEKLMEESFPPELKKLLTDGILDDVPIYIENTFATYQISMTPEEAQALQSHISSNHKGNRNPVSPSPREQDILQEFNALSSNIQKMRNTHLTSYDIGIKDSYLYTCLLYTSPSPRDP